MVWSPSAAIGTEPNSPSGTVLLQRGAQGNRERGLAIHEVLDDKVVDWMEHVTDSDYGA